DVFSPRFVHFGARLDAATDDVGGGRELLGTGQVRLDRALLADLPADLVDGAYGPQLAVGEDPDAVADARELRQDVAGDEQRLAEPGQPQHKIAHLAARLVIDAIGWLCKKVTLLFVQ